VTLWVGVDVGGTYTDLVAIDSEGAVEARKVLSTPTDQSEGVLDAMKALARHNIDRFVHGTTVATNMLLERKGARVAFCVTQGFSDLLFLRRQDRASLYDLTAHHPVPLAPRDLTVPVAERVEPQGVTLPLTAEVADHVADQIAALKPDVVAVLLLHSYREPRHELMIRDAIRRRTPDIEVVLSSDVFPEIREYERASTTVAEAYLRPGVARYLKNLDYRLNANATDRPNILGVMTSSGGMRGMDEATRSAASLALSGPAGGVVGAAAIARLLNIDRALTIDIGGTSADVGLILDGQPLVEQGGSVADVPISMPRVLVETVSAGGGSIAWVDAAGALHAGPHSAGARPGPVAFGRGGTLPTVTDAHVALGRIASEQMSGGIALDVAAAKASIAVLAKSLGETEARTATAIIATADATMARALRRVSVERGIDPRTCTLIAFGGGGPLHACGLADQLGVTRVVAPPHAGVLSALGLAMTPERREAMVSVMRALDGWLDRERNEIMETVSEQAWPRTQNPKPKARAWYVRARYQGQGHELDIPVLQRQPKEEVRSAFEAQHNKRYGFTLDAPVEIVSLRHVAEGVGRVARFTTPTAAARRRLVAPVSLALDDATLFVAPGWNARMHESGAWLLTKAG